MELNMSADDSLIDKFSSPVLLDSFYDSILLLTPKIEGVSEEARASLSALVVNSTMGASLVLQAMMLKLVNGDDTSEVRDYAVARLTSIVDAELTRLKLTTEFHELKKKLHIRS